MPVMESDEEEGNDNQRDSGIDSMFLKNLLRTDFFDESQEPAIDYRPSSQTINAIGKGQTVAGVDDESAELLRRIAERSTQDSDGDDNSDEEGKVDYFCSQNRYHKNQSTMLDNGL